MCLRMGFFGEPKGVPLPLSPPGSLQTVEAVRITHDPLLGGSEGVLTTHPVQYELLLGLKK